MLVMIVVLVIGVASILVSSLSATSLENRRNRVTADALAKAKEALIGYAITYGDTHPGIAHGYLPCPDADASNGEGSSPSGSCGAQNVSQIGRFPWRTLDLPDLYDGTGECLWYAVSGTYKNNPPTANMMNWDNASLLQVYTEDGITEISPGDIVAVIIAPGSAQAGNSSRAPSGAAPTCGGNYTAAAYLDNDADHGIDNADISQNKFILPHEHRDANGNVTFAVNDRFVFITRQDIWRVIETRVLRDARKCLDAYAASSGNKYPWPASVSSGAYVGIFNTNFGRIADSPNREGPYTTSDPDINDMFDYLDALQTALDNYAADNNATTRAALDAAGDNLSDTADDIYDAGTMTDVAFPARSAGWRAEHLADGDWGYTVAGVQSRINEANVAIDALPTTIDTAMSASWPTIPPSTTACFADTVWSQWKSLVFVQIAEDYTPGGSTTDCITSGTCLSLQVSGQSQTGSGTHRAMLVGAGKKINNPPLDPRTPATLGDYVELTNQSPQTNNAIPYTTYRVTDGEYKSVNDQGLCIDGGTNCL